MPNPPNFNPGTGALVTSRYDFQSHVSGTSFRHNATEIDVSPSIDGYATVDSALRGLQNEIDNLSTSVTLNGDVTGTSGSNTVVKVHGASVPAAGSLVTGTVLQVVGSSSLVYGLVNLASNVTGVLPTGNQAAQAMTGDVSGTTAANAITSISGSPSGSTVTVNSSTLQWANSVAVPTLTQATPGAGVSGVALSIVGQHGGSGSTTGGDLQLSSGNASTPGKISFQTGGTSQVYIINTNPLSSGPSVFQWDAAAGSPAINQASTTSTPGQALSITAQQSTNGSGVGGDLNLSGGQAIQTGGNVNIASGFAGVSGNVNIKSASTTLMSFIQNTGSPAPQSGVPAQNGIFIQTSGFAETHVGATSLPIFTYTMTSDCVFLFEVTWVARTTSSVVQIGKTYVYGYFISSAFGTITATDLYNQHINGTIAAVPAITTGTSSGTLTIKVNQTSSPGANWQAIIVGQVC